MTKPRSVEKHPEKQYLHVSREPTAVFLSGRGAQVQVVPILDEGPDPSWEPRDSYKTLERGISLLSGTAWACLPTLASGLRTTFN